jgi:hypothetical protein
VNSKTNLAFYLLGICVMLSSCYSSSFETKVVDWLRENDSTFLEVIDIDVVEELPQEETAGYLEKKLIEEKARLLNQYKLRSCEPCVINKPGCPKVSYTIADLKSKSIDSVLFPNRKVLGGCAGTYFCDINLFEKKALFDSANRGLLRKDEVTINHLKSLLSMAPRFYRLKVNFTRKDFSDYSQNLVVRVSSRDTIITDSESNLNEFLTPGRPPHPRMTDRKEIMVPVRKTSMGAGGRGMSVLNRRIINRLTRDSDWISWDSSTINQYNRKSIKIEKWIHNGIYAVVDTSQVINFHDGGGAYPIFIYNLTDQVNLFYISNAQQALDSLGKWRAIEGDNGIPYEGTSPYFIEPQQVGVVMAKIYDGDYNTKLRTKLVFQSYHSNEYVVAFTEEYSGKIDYRQFTPKVEFPTGTLEDDPEPWFRKYWWNKEQEKIKAMVRNKTSF